MNDDADDVKRPWLPAPPGRLVGRGHPAGDFLEAYDWRVLDHAPGRYRIEAHLPKHVLNPRGHLFGGFAPTYIDLLAIYTGRSDMQVPFRGFATVNMRVDYFEPVLGERFILESRIVHTRDRTFLVEVLFKDLEDNLLIFSIVTLRRRT